MKNLKELFQKCHNPNLVLCFCKNDVENDFILYEILSNLIMNVYCPNKFKIDTNRYYFSALDDILYHNTQLIKYRF